MFKLAHISDVHLGPLPPVLPWQLANKRITGYLNWKLNRRSQMGIDVLAPLVAHMKASNPDHIIVSGDLTNLALPSEINRMEQWLRDLGDPGFVSATLGNHDAYVPGAARACQRSWAPYMRGDGETDVPGPDAAPVQSPYRRDRGDVAMIIANSGVATLPFIAGGWLGKRQISHAANLIRLARADGKQIVFVVHHPPFQGATPFVKKLFDDAALRQMLARNGVDLVLHGHTHLDTLAFIDGPGKPIPVVGVASASQSPTAAGEPHGHKPAAQYNLLTFEKAGQPIVLERIGYRHGETRIKVLEEKQLG